MNIKFIFLIFVSSTFAAKDCPTELFKYKDRENGCRKNTPKMANKCLNKLYKLEVTKYPHCKTYIKNHFSKLHAMVTNEKCHELSLLYTRDYYNCVNIKGSRRATCLNQLYDSIKLRHPKCSESLRKKALNDLANRESTSASALNEKNENKFSSPPPTKKENVSHSHQ